SERDLTRFVIHLKDDVLTEILQRNLRAQPAAEVPDLVGPFLEFGVVRDTAVERDGVVFRAARRFAATAGITAFPVLNDFGCALKSANFADTRNIAAIPFDAELEVFVGVEPARINGELSHRIVAG